MKIFTFVKLIFLGIILISCSGNTEEEVREGFKPSPTEIYSQINDENYLEIKSYDKNGNLLETGKGSYISADGKVISAYHIVEKSETIFVCENAECVLGKIENKIGDIVFLETGKKVSEFFELVENKSILLEDLYFEGNKYKTLEKREEFGKFKNILIFEKTFLSGDSGKIILNSKNEIVGIVVGNDETSGKGIVQEVGINYNK